LISQCTYALGLCYDYNAQLFCTLHCFIGYENGVLYTMTRVRARIGFHSQLDRIQRHIHGSIT
jgi:hypothetical protein